MSVEGLSTQGRAAVHAALGNATRLSIVDILTLRDASPGEIANALGLETNLLAHHVNVLQRAGLVTRRPSNGDSRRIYLHLAHEVLAALTDRIRLTAPRVVFVCTENAARSQLAAAIWRRESQVPVASAGTAPARRVHPLALRVARKRGLTINPTATAHIADIVRDDDLVITVCDVAHEHLPDSVVRRLHWSVPDPAVVGTEAAFARTYDELSERIAQARHHVGVGTREVKAQ